MRDDHIWFILWTIAFFIFFFGLWLASYQSEYRNQVFRLKHFCVEQKMEWNAKAEACKEKAP